MKLNEEKFNELLKAHKKVVSAIGRYAREGTLDLDKEEGNCPIFAKMVITGKELALCLYIKEKGGDFREDLQFHHLIGRTNKKLLPKYQYFTQRNYWANIIVIPQAKHKANHSPDKCITKELFEKVKKDYFKNDK